MPTDATGLLAKLLREVAMSRSCWSQGIEARQSSRVELTTARRYHSSGHGFEGAVEPVVTVILALPKVSLRALTPPYLADLGLPAVLWERMGLDPGTPYAEGRLVRVES